jgi:hypothetical protein
MFTMTNKLHTKAPHKTEREWEWHQQPMVTLTHPIQFNSLFTFRTSYNLVFMLHAPNDT